MKSTTMAIALVLLYVLIIPPESYGARGPAVRPGSIMRPQQAVFAHPGPMRPPRALPQGHFRQPGPEQAGRMGAARPRYARDDASAAALILAGRTVAYSGGVVEPFVVRQTDALAVAVNDGSNMGTAWTDKQRVALQKGLHASYNMAEATMGDLAAVSGGAMDQHTTRRRRYNVNL